MSAHPDCREPWVTCPACERIRHGVALGGSGRTDDGEVCPTCEGRGMVPKRKATPAPDRQSRAAGEPW